MTENQPEKKFVAGGVTVTCWKNEGKDGAVFHNYTVQRRYKDGDDWKNTDSFGRNDLVKLKVAVDKALEYEFLKDAD